MSRRHVSLGYEEGEASSTGGPAPAPIPPPAAPVAAAGASLPFAEVGRLPTPDDNVAIAGSRVEGGTIVDFVDPKSGEAYSFPLRHTVLEGHRFAVRPIAVGEYLLSWGMPFGAATVPIEPGHYCCNPSIIEALAVRKVDFALPDTGNFEDKILPCRFDESEYEAGEQVSLLPEDDQMYFDGFVRPANRGVGTRNYIVVLGLSSHSSGFVRKVSAAFKRASFAGTTLDGVVPVGHTEADHEDNPLNLSLLVQTLSGWASHPNVGAALVVEDANTAEGDEPVMTFPRLCDAAAARGIDLTNPEHVTVTPLKLSGDFAGDVEKATETVRAWMSNPAVANAPRTKRPTSDIRVALQCGGSDAFSGVSGNPLVGHVAREVIRRGGAAVLAETPELIGAEPYIIRNTRSVEVTKNFLDFVERFKARVAHHGSSAEANPSGGNKFRGLYNIALKSLGAAAKKAPDVRLDGVLDYGEPLPRERGYFFMNSPGNDLESIAGQVATGCNFVFFTTGNGSITNFPFVPTIKVLTTTRRFEMLKEDMDFNAGAYQDGTPMPELGMQLLRQTLQAASGTRTAGEKAGHSQVSIWRRWEHTSMEEFEAAVAARKEYSGEALVTKVAAAAATPDAPQFSPLTTKGSLAATDSVALVLPTSICSSQIAGLIAERLNARLQRERAAAEESKGDDDSGAFAVPMGDHVTRFVALPHTEGCGSSGAEDLYARVMLGHVVHPNVAHCVLLEHGCEKHHNDSVRADMAAVGVDPSAFGWASVQADGGIEKVARNVERLFESSVAATPKPAPAAPTSSLAGVCFGVMAAESIPADIGAAFANMVCSILSRGGDVIMSETSSLLKSSWFLDEVLETHDVTPTLGFGQRPPRKTAVGDSRPGQLHVMECPTSHWVETVVGIASCGAQLVVAYSRRPRQGHPLVPTLCVADANIPAGATEATAPYKDADLVLGRADPATASGVPNATAVAQWTETVYKATMDVANRTMTPIALAAGNVDFQISRGSMGVSV